MALPLGGGMDHAPLGDGAGRLRVERCGLGRGAGQQQGKGRGTAQGARPPQLRSFASTPCNCMALDMSPSTFNLPCMKAVMPSNLPSLIACQSSQLTLMVVSAAPSSSVTALPAPSSITTPSEPKSSFTLLPGSQALFSLRAAAISLLVMIFLPLGRPSLLYVNVRSRGAAVRSANERYPDQPDSDIHRSTIDLWGEAEMDQSGIIAKGPDGYYHPNNEDEIVALVKYAAANKLQIR